MKIEEVQIGLKVICDGDREDIQTITSMPDQDGMVVITSLLDDTDLIHVSYLDIYDPEKEQKAIESAQRSLDEATSVFEQAFFLLRQARDIASSANLDLPNRRMFDVSGLESVVEKHGWSSSSIWC